MILQALSKFFGFSCLAKTESDLTGFIEKVEEEKEREHRERVEAARRDLEERGKRHEKRKRQRNMECGDYTDTVRARIAAQETIQRQLKEQANKRERLEKVRQIAITLVAQQVASGRVGTEPWALRAAFEDARPKAEAIYDAAQEYVK